MWSMKVKFTLFLGVLLVGVVVIWQPAKKYLCLEQGGKWASNGSFCIYKDCAENGSCLPSYRNSAICEGLELGIDQQTLYFQLGMPESSKGDVYTFAGGGGELPIEAVIKNNKLVNLKCST